MKISPRLVLITAGQKVTETIGFPRAGVAACWRRASDSLRRAPYIPRKAYGFGDHN